MVDKEQKRREKELKKITKQMNKSEEQVIVVRFIIILVLVVGVILGIYFFTKNFVAKDEDKKANETKEVTFDYSKIIFGELLNRPYDEYYVIAYDAKNDPQMNYYGNLAYVYGAKENSLKVYTADLNDSMNAKFYNKDKSNPKAKSVAELAVGDLTLIKVKDSQIVKYLEDIEAIKAELGV